VCGCLAVLILLFGPVSGAHFNPVVSAADWLLGRRAGTGISVGHVAFYTVAQITGCTLGAILANSMFDRQVFEIATKDRITTGHLVGVEALLPAPDGVGRFVIRATRERGVGVPSSRSLATASHEAT